MSGWHLPRFSRARAWGLKCVVGRQARTIMCIEERGVQVLKLWRIESYMARYLYSGQEGEGREASGRYRKR